MLTVLAVDLPVSDKWLLTSVKINTIYDIDFTMAHRKVCCIGGILWNCDMKK